MPLRAGFCTPLWSRLRDWPGKVLAVHPGLVPRVSAVEAAGRVGFAISPRGVGVL